MTFPVWLDLFGWRLHPHPVFEGLGYFAGARLYFSLRKREPAAAAVPLETNLWLLVGALLGALLGAKILAWVESPSVYFHGGWRALWGDPTVITVGQTTYVRHDWSALLGGKTIVGALLGGWAGVEIVKARTGVHRSTGDLFVYPLALGTAIGRLGCFFTGLADHTYGIATSLPWGVDFGDGVYRHPTQLYESLFVLALAGALWLGTRRHRLPPGALFRLYLAGYLLWRFLVEFIKPREILVMGLSAIQVASLTGALVALWSFARLRRAPAPPAETAAPA